MVRGVQSAGFYAGYVAYGLRLERAHADGVLPSANVPRPSGSSFISLRGAPGALCTTSAALVLADPAIQERFKRLGVEPRMQSADEFQKLLRADWDAMGAVVKASGAKID